MLSSGKLLWTFFELPKGPPFFLAQSRQFTRQLAQHQNIQWAFKNITPYTTQYHVASDELFKLMRLFVQRQPDATEEEEAEIRNFRHQTLQLYLSILDGRSSWSTLIAVLKILVESDDDRVFVVYNNGLSLIFDAVNTLHMMFHEVQITQNFYCLPDHHTSVSGDRMPRYWRIGRHTSDIPGNFGESVSLWIF